MKQTLLLFALLAFGSTQLEAQLFPLKTKTDSLQFRVVAAQNRLALEWLGGSNFPLGKTDFLTIENIALDDADLVVAFSNGKIENGFSTDVSIGLRRADGQVFVPKKGAWQSLPTELGKLVFHKKAWLDATETTLDFGQTYTIFITRRLLGPVDCTAERPIFSLKKQLSFYSMSAVGGVAVGLGLFVFNPQKKTAYQTYRNFWADERTKTEAQPFLETAQKKERAAQIFTIGGLAVVALDALFFTRKRLKMWHAQKIYDQFCQKPAQKMSVRPFAENQFLSVAAPPEMRLGLRISF